MNFSSISKILQNNGFEKTEQSFIYKYETDAEVKLILILDDDQLSQRFPDYHEIYMKVLNQYRERERAIYCLMLVASSDVNSVRDRLWEHDLYWIVDVAESRLVIYENQPDDFEGIKNELEHYLESADSLIVKLKENEVGRNVFTVNFAIVAINIVVFLILAILGDTEDPDFMLNHGAMYVPIAFYVSEWYRFFTAAFMHFGISHLFNNMLVLFFLGPMVEEELGWVKYLILYLLTCVIGNIGSAYVYTITGNLMVVSAGASGAVFGVIGALAYLVIRNSGQLKNISIKRLMFMILGSVFVGFESISTNNAAHVIGLAAGFILAVFMYRKKKAKH